MGHTLKKSPNYITRQALSWNPPGKRKQGGQFTTWQSSVRKEAAQLGKCWNALAGLAANKVRWISLLSALRF